MGLAIPKFKNLKLNAFRVEAKTNVTFGRQLISSFISENGNIDPNDCPSKHGIPGNTICRLTLNGDNQENPFGFALNITGELQYNYFYFTNNNAASENWHIIATSRTDFMSCPGSGQDIKFSLEVANIIQLLLAVLLLVK